MIKNMAEEKKIEETIENQLLTKEEIAEVETLGDKKDDELTPEQKANKKLYARMKTAEEGKKALRDEIAKKDAKIAELEKKGQSTEDEEKKKAALELKLDPIEFAKQVRKLSSLDDDELAHAQILAIGMGKKIEEVIETQDFKTWAEGNKTKKENDKKILDTTNKKGETVKIDATVQKWTDNLPNRFKPKN